MLADFACNCSWCGVVLHPRELQPSSSAEPIIGRYSPRSAIASATFWATTTRPLLDKPGNQMLAIPDLDHSRISEPGEHVGIGPAPVGRQHRLPDGEDADIALRIALQYGIDLRTPLQADGTCRRQQKHPLVSRRRND